MENVQHDPNMSFEGFNDDIAKAFSGQEIDDSMEFVAATTEADAQVDKDGTEQQDTTATAESSLTETAESQDENKEIKADEISPKSFEELLAERTGGKFNKWDEIEAALNSPKEDFFDDEVRRINELKKQGVNIDRQWFEMQTRDYENIEDPIEILSESMKLENPKMSQKEIEWEIRNKYQIDKWSKEGQDEDDISPESRELEEVMSAKMLREAEEKRDKLIELRDKTSWKAPNNPEAEAKTIAEAKARQDAWEKTVEDVSSQISKLTNKVSDKDAFEYVLDDSEKKEVSSMMKQMGSNAAVFWQQFVEDGKINQLKVYETIVKARNYDKAVTSAYQKGLAYGTEQEVRNLKNINFKQDQQSSTPTTLDPVAKAVLDSFFK